MNPGEVLGRYLDHIRVERGLASNTIAAYRRDLTGYLAFLEGRGIHDLREVGETDISEYVRELHTTSATASTARRVVSLRSLHQFAFDERLTVDNPAKNIVVPKQQRLLPKALSIADVERLLAAPDRESAVGLRDAALLELLYSTGARIGLARSTSTRSRRCATTPTPVCFCVAREERNVWCRSAPSPRMHSMPTSCGAGARWPARERAIRPCF